MAELAGALNRIVETDGVRAVVVAANDGLMIDGAKKDEKEDLEALAALAASIGGSLRSLASELGRQALQQVIAEFGDGTVLIQPVGTDATLAVFSTVEGNLGRLRFLVRRRASEVNSQLNQL